MVKTSFLLLIVFLCGCVSVNLGAGSSIKKANDVRFTAPSTPFESESRENVDNYWRNKANGNSISYVSDCTETTDPDLDTIATGVLSGLRDLRFDRNELVQYRSREAKRILASGKVDGVPSKIELLVFKRNRCIYILNYVSLEKTYSANSRDFEAFVQGFNPP